MKFFLRSLGLLLLISAGVTELGAQTAPSYHLVLVKFIHDGTKTFTYTLTGIKDHLELLGLQGDKEEGYAALQPIVKRLEDKQNGANVTSIVLGSLAGGVAVTGVVIAASNPLWIDDHSSGNDVIMPQKLNPASLLGFTLIFAGVSGGLFGITVPQIVGGLKDDDILSYINAYNTLYPDHPLEVY